MAGTWDNYSLVSDNLYAFNNNSLYPYVFSTTAENNTLNQIDFSDVQGTCTLSQLGNPNVNAVIRFTLYTNVKVTQTSLGSGKYLRYITDANTIKPTKGIIILKNGYTAYVEKSGNNYIVGGCAIGNGATFSQISVEETDYYIYFGDVSRYLRIFREKDVQTLTNVTFTSVTEIPSNKQTFEPLQSVTVGTLQATPQLTYKTSNSIEDGETTTTSNGATQYTSFASSYSSVGTKTVSVSYEGHTQSWSIAISDWSSKVYSFRAKSGASFKIYSGKEIGNDFLTAYEIIYTKTSNYGTLVDVVKANLEKEKMSKTIISESDSVLAFDYDISDISETSTTSISLSVSSGIHKLASGSDKYANVQRKVVYELNDVISQTASALSGSLTYDDGTTIALENCSITSLSITSTLGTLPITITEQTEDSFGITYSFNTTYFGNNLGFTDDCTKGDSAQVDRVEFRSLKTTFYPDEVIEFGSSAYVLVYNKNNQIIKTINNADLVYYITNKSSAYGQYAVNYLRDGFLTLTCKCYGLTLEHKIVFIYDEPTLILDVSSVQTSYYFDVEDDTFDFDYDDLIVYSKRHTNTISNGEVSTAITNTDVTHLVTKSHNTIVNRAERYAVTVVMNNDYGQRLSGEYYVNAEPIKAVSISASNITTAETQYYDNGIDTFKEPEDMVFTVTFNNRDTEVVDVDDLVFYRDEELTEQLTDETTVIAPISGNNRIYFRSVDYDVVGAYAITFIEDAIISVALDSAITICLGNKLNKYKSGVTLNCTHSSSNVTQITNASDFDFERTDIITSEPSTLNVLIGGVSYAITNVETKVVWTNPYGKIELNLNNFQTEYNNSVDIIRPSNIVAKIVYYEDNNLTNKCDYERSIAYSSTLANSTFTVTDNGDLNYYEGSDHSYTYGVDKIKVDMGGQNSVSRTLTITAKNEFSTSSVTKSLAVEIFEILDITGIKLKNAKTTYYFGETFLNEEDDTELTIFYNDTQNNPRTYDIKLRNGMSALNIYPLKGTEFTKIANNKVITISSAKNDNIKVQYSIDVKANYIYSDTKKHHLVTIYLENYVCPDGVSRSKYYLVESTKVMNGETIETTIKNSAGIRVLNNIDVTDLDVLGYLEDVGNTAINGRVILFKDYISPIEGSNNITVKFPCYVAGNADLINKCHFGIMFGNNNSKNRLFLSGNKTYANKDWHSGEVDIESVEYEEFLNGNYAYFEDLSECVYGETDNAVVGYDIVSNDKLLVLKGYSDKETTVYFRQPQLVTAINGSGTAVTGLDDETLYQEEFSLVKGNNSVAGVNPKAIVNFNGDSLFISHDKKVVGLDLVGIVGDNQRYANTRSYYIDEELKRYDLSNAILWSDNNYLFVVLKDKVYLTHFETKGGTQYEWFVIDIPNVTSVIKIGEKYYFGTSDGKLIKNNDEYRDAKKVFVGYGIAKLTVNAQTELITAINQLSELDENKKYMFKPVAIGGENATHKQFIYYNLGSIMNDNTADCDFYVNNSNNENIIELVCKKNGKTDYERLNLLIKRIQELKPVFLCKLNDVDTGIVCKENSVFETIVGEKLFLKEYLDATSRHLYQIVYENGTPLPVKELYRARLCMQVTEPTEISSINATNGTFKLIKDGEELDIIQYNEQSLSSAFKGEIIEYSNVEAYYITKPYTMGSLEYLKTVWSFTLTNDTNIPSELDLCYASNKIPYENMKTLAHISKDALGFDFGEFNFYKVDFDKNVVPRTYTHKRILSGVKFVCFGFRNYKDSNSVLSSMTITYTLPYPSYSGD